MIDRFIRASSEGRSDKRSLSFWESHLNIHAAGAEFARVESDGISRVRSDLIQDAVWRVRPARMAEPLSFYLRSRVLAVSDVLRPRL
jgi:hypothetical protein